MAEIEIVLHPIPTPDSKPYIIVFGPDQHLWFCESGTSKIGRLHPANGAFTEFATPTPDSRPIGITSAADGALWFCENAPTRSGGSPRRARSPSLRFRRAELAQTALSRPQMEMCGSPRPTSAMSAASRLAAR